MNILDKYMIEGRLVFYPNSWASGEIRGRQMAAAVGGIIDANIVYPDDVLVFIKGGPPQHIIDYVRQVYVDVDDSYGSIPYLEEHPEVCPIAASRVGQRYLNERLGRDNVLLIPGHHCNFERFVKVTSDVKTAGFIGYPENLHLGVDTLHSALGGVGINFVVKTDAKNREDVCSFYKSIDIQICFRKMDEKVNPAPELRDPLKLINAGSFGIPTVAYPEPSYVDEFNGCFLQVDSPENIPTQCLKLKNDGWFYHKMSMLVLQQAEQYHIEHIAPMFARLRDES